MGTLPVRLELARGFTAAVAVLNAARTVAAIGMPAASVALPATATETVAFAGHAAFGVKRTTVSFSANPTTPAIVLPATFTVSARAVVPRSIFAVNRVEMVVSRAILVARSAGRNWATDGGTAVCTASSAVGRTRPSVSSAPATIRRYATSGRSGASGTNRKRNGPAALSPGRPIASIEPATGGSSRIAAGTVAASTGRANETTNEVRVRTRSLTASVAAIETAVAARVRKIARAGRVSGCPDRASAPASTVTVWNTPAAQWLIGLTVRTVSSAPQVSTTAVAGSTWSVVATERRSIGVENRIVTGSVTPWLVATAASNSACVSGTMGRGAVATVVAGWPIVRTLIPSIMAAPRAMLTRAWVERRSAAPMEAANRLGAASSAALA